MPESQYLEKFTGLAKNCDAELSIEARRILRWEAHPSSDCAEFVWEPTHEFLKKLAERKPKYLLCCRSRPFSPPNRDEEESVDVDIIDPDWKTAYLGMVVNVKTAISVWNKIALNRLEKALLCAEALEEPRMKELFDDYTSRLKRMLSSGQMSIVRRNIGCFIPVETDHLSRRTTEKGVKKILAALMPSLAEIPIRWAVAKEQEEFERFVEMEARKRAKPQTDQERRDIFLPDVE